MPGQDRDDLLSSDTGPNLSLADLLTWARDNHRTDLVVLLEVLVSPVVSPPEAVSGIAKTRRTRRLDGTLPALLISLGMLSIAAASLYFQIIWHL